MTKLLKVNVRQYIQRVIAIADCWMLAGVTVGDAVRSVRFATTATVREPVDTSATDPRGRGVVDPRRPACGLLAVVL